MRVTTWTEYSLIIALHLAKRLREGGTAVPARELAEVERLPADYTEQILLRLRRHGLVTSVRGAKGGYRLARTPEVISVHEVMTAAEHQTFELNCETHKIDAARCAHEGNCSIRPMWAALKLRVDGFLQGVMLADLMHDEADVRQLVTLDPA